MNSYQHSIYLFNQHVTPLALGRNKTQPLLICDENKKYHFSPTAYRTSLATPPLATPPHAIKQQLIFSEHKGCNLAERHSQNPLKLRFVTLQTHALRLKGSVHPAYRASMWDILAPVRHPHRCSETICYFIGFPRFKTPPAQARNSLRQTDGAAVRVSSHPPNLF